MSLLRFIKRNRAELPTETATVTAPPAPPAPAPHVDVFAAPPLAAPAPVDLDRIRRELQEIQNIVGAEETLYGQTRAPQDAVDVDMKLGELIRLCPQAFKDPEALQQASQTVIQVSVPDLYGQLTQGRVATKLHLLTADIPLDYLSPYAAEHADDAIPLPLHMVVGCIQPEDLRRRTASQERDLGDKQLPNLFTAGSVAAAAAAIAAPEPPAPVADLPVAAAEVTAEPSTQPEPASTAMPETVIAEVVQPTPVPELVSEPVPELVAELPAPEEPAQHQLEMVELPTAEPDVAEVAPAVAEPVPAESMAAAHVEDEG